MKRAQSLLAAAVFVAGCAAAAPDERADGPRPPKNVSPLEKQLADHPDDPKVNLELGDQSAQVGDYLRAQQYYERAEALQTPERVVLPRILRMLVLGRRYDEALERCHRQLSHKPDDRATRMVEAAILEALDRPRDAEHELASLVRTEPRDPHPYLALGKLYRDAYHDDARARSMFQKYLALAPHGDEADAIRYQLQEDTPLPEPQPALVDPPITIAPPPEAAPSPPATPPSKEPAP